MGSSTLSCTLLLIAALAATTTSHAAPPGTKAPILVLESYTGDRSPAASGFMSILNPELEARGFVVKADAITRLAGDHLPRPGVQDTNVNVAQVARNVEAAYIQFRSGDYAAAAALASAAIDVMQRNPALFVLDNSNNDVMFKALATLALCKGMLKEPATAVEKMKELIRMFPTKPLPRDKYGPDDEKFYQAVKQQVSQMGRGRFTIAGGDARAVIFVDGQIRGVGSAAIADLIPGLYHVFVQVPGTPGRAYEVQVYANGEATLNVAYAIDLKLWITSQWSGFVFANDIERQSEPQYASTISRRWSPGADRIAVIGTRQDQGREALFATLYASDGTEMFAVKILLSEVTDAKLRMLAQFLADADGTSTDGLTILRGLGETKRADAPSRARTSKLLPWTMIAAGGLTIAAGAILVAIDEDDDGSMYKYNDSGPAGITLLATGAVASAAGLVGMKFGHRPNVPYVLVGVGASAIGAGIALILVDEDAAPQQQKDITNSAPAGTALVIGGSVVTIAGALLWLRERRPAVTPVVTFDRSGASVGWAGRF